MKNTRLFILTLSYVLDLHTASAKTVVTSPKEIEDIVMRSLVIERESIPSVDVDDETVAKEKELLDSLFSHFGVCAQLPNAKLRYCNLATEEDEKFEVTGYMTQLDNHQCRLKSFRFMINRKEEIENPSTWMFPCPRIVGNKSKRYYLGNVNSSLNQITVYLDNVKKSRITPIRVILDITSQDLFGMANREKPAEVNHDVDAAIDKLTQVSSISNSPPPIQVN